MKGNVKVALLGIGGAIVTGVVTKVTETCPTLIPNLWPILSAGVIAGIAVWVRSPKDEAK